MTMRDMWDELRAHPVRELVADLIGMAAICVMLYAFVIFASGLVER